MSKFGDRLRRERESRDASIDDIAATTKIHRRFLEALERDEFETLPGAAYGKFYIRAYAEVLGFDPEPLIADYDRERYRLERDEPPDSPADEPDPPKIEDEAPADEPAEAEAPEAPVESERPSEPPAADPVPEPPEVIAVEPAPEPSGPEVVRSVPASRAESRQRAAAVALVCVATLIVGALVYFAFFRTETVTDEPATAPETVQAAARLAGVIADHPHGFVHPTPPTVGPELGERAGAPQTHARPLSHQPLQPGEGFVEMPDWRTEPAR